MSMIRSTFLFLFWCSLMNALNAPRGLLECDTIFLCPEDEHYIVACMPNQHGIVSQKTVKLSHLNTVSDNAFEFLFSGPVLPSDSDIYDVPLVRSREKQLLVASILDSFSNLLPSATYLRSNVNTGMGFLLGNFLPSDQ